VEVYRCGGWHSRASVPQHAARGRSSTTLLDDDLDGVPLQVVHVLRVLGHRSHAGMEVRTLWVCHVLKTLPSHGLLLLTDQKQRDRHRGGVVEAALTQGGDGDMCCLLNRLI
jgi:hypothetical protein